jgi:hypothetical protein
MKYAVVRVFSTSSFRQPTVTAASSLYLKLATFCSCNIVTILSFIGGMDSCISCTCSVSSTSSQCRYRYPMQSRCCWCCGRWLCDSCARAAWLADNREVRLCPDCRLRPKDFCSGRCGRRRRRREFDITKLFQCDTCDAPFCKSCVGFMARPPGWSAICATCIDEWSGSEEVRYDSEEGEETDEAEEGEETDEAPLPSQEVITFTTCTSTTN